MAASPGDANNEHLKVNAVKSDQSSPWSADVFLDSSGSSKLHYDLGVSNQGWSVLAYEEGNNYDIYAMRINPDGTLGSAYYPAPQSLAGYVDNQGIVYLNWQAPSLAPSQYQVYMNDALILTISADLTNCSIPDLEAGNYSFYVCAVYPPDIYRYPPIPLI